MPFSLYMRRVKVFAESEGFKPPVRTSRTADFESAPIDHSGNFPFLFIGRKGMHFRRHSKIYRSFFLVTLIQSGHDLVRYIHPRIAVKHDRLVENHRVFLRAVEIL